MSQVWVFMRMKPDVPNRWDIMGVFSTRELAAAACMTDCDLIFPLTLDERLPDEDLPLPAEWPCGNARNWEWDIAGPRHE
jgi:hypothetical protein